MNHTLVFRFICNPLFSLPSQTNATVTPCHRPLHPRSLYLSQISPPPHSLNIKCNPFHHMLAQLPGGWPNGDWNAVVCVCVCVCVGVCVCVYVCMFVCGVVSLHSCVSVYIWRDFLCNCVRVFFFGSSCMGPDLTFVCSYLLG
jgi:hypothetical protein